MEKSGGEAGGEGQCGDMPWRDDKKERCSLEILSVEKEANLLGRGTDEEEIGNGDVDLRWSSLLILMVWLSNICATL